jgi:hypothetical protein
MRNVSIGFMRDDGDFQILATFNNSDGLMSDINFSRLVRDTRERFIHLVDETMVALERQDAPDYVTLENNRGE